jgi:hypothetical protein
MTKLAIALALMLGAAHAQTQQQHFQGGARRDRRCADHAKVDELRE